MILPPPTPHRRPERMCMRPGPAGAALDRSVQSPAIAVLQSLTPSDSQDHPREPLDTPLNRPSPDHSGLAVPAVRHRVGLNNLGLAGPAWGHRPLDLLGAESRCVTL